MKTSEGVFLIALVSIAFLSYLLISRRADLDAKCTKIQMDIDKYGMILNRLHMKDNHWDCQRVEWNREYRADEVYHYNKYCPVPLGEIPKFTFKHCDKEI